MRAYIPVLKYDLFGKKLGISLFLIVLIAFEYALKFAYMPFKFIKELKIFPK